MTVQLIYLYSGQVNVKTTKYKDLPQLLPFVPPTYHDYYRGLPHGGMRQATQPAEDEINEGQEDDDYEDDILE